MFLIKQKKDLLSPFVNTEGHIRDWFDGGESYSRESCCGFL